jgi:hypothetical protein
MDRSEPYRSLILDHVPRVLGLVDREAMSPTAGCCDRTFWAWKFVDFPRSRFQEAACVLAFLYATELEGNTLHGNYKVLGWIRAILRYWTTLQHADGSFDEAYPFERSLAATAFTTFYVSEAVGFLGDELEGIARTETLAAIRKAGEWLCRNDETHGFLSNHLAAAAAALEHAHRLTGEARFADRRAYFVDRILERQSGEGWYEEYGGADPGYQTHGSFYLARIAELTDDERLRESLDRATEFLAHCVHPDGSLGGEYASRNTQTYYPAAFEMTAHRSGAAAWIADTLRPSVESAAAAGLRGSCPYNLFPLLNNLVFAWRAASDDGPRQVPTEPTSAREMTWFPEAGIARVRGRWYDAWVGASKGGVVKVFHREKKKLLYSDCGYVGRLDRVELASSQYLDRSRPIAVEDDRIEVSGAFRRVSRPTMTPWRFTLFRAFMLTLGRAPGLARRVKNLLVRVLIGDKPPLDVRLRRVIRFEERAVVVEDRLEGADASRFHELSWEESLTTIHMGSARYFVPAELERAEVEPADDLRIVDPARVVEGLELVRRVPAG